MEVKRIHFSYETIERYYAFISKAILPDKCESWAELPEYVRGYRKYTIRIKICFLYRYCSMNINGMQEKIYENINVISLTHLLWINFFTGNTDREAGKYFREFDLHNAELSR